MTSRSADLNLLRQDLLGFFTHPGTLDDYIKYINTSIGNRQSITVYYHNLHTLYGYFNSPELKQSFEKKTVIVDGMGVLLLYKLAACPINRNCRLTYVDFIIPLMTLARDNNWRVFHVGQHSQVQKKAIEILRSRVPGIQIDGEDGFFDQRPFSDDSLRIIKRINDFSTDLLLVGLGTPRQEIWVDTHRDSIRATAVLTSGSCMEYVAQAVKTPPRWMGRSGLEWLWRLIENPRRFAYRYLIQPLLLSVILLRNWFHMHSRNR